MIIKINESQKETLRYSLELAFRDRAYSYQEKETKSFGLIKYYEPEVRQDIRKIKLLYKKLFNQELK